MLYCKKKIGQVPRDLIFLSTFLYSFHNIEIWGYIREINATQMVFEAVGIRLWTAALPSLGHMAA